MNQYPLWKYLLILIIVLVGGVYALPNLYGEDPALQISLRNGTLDVPATLQQVNELLTPSSVQGFTTEAQGDDKVLVRFKDTESQLVARDLLMADNALGSAYNVAPNLVPATPQWLRDINALPMYLGLDLRGGIHVLLEVDVDTAVAQSYERYRGEFRNYLQEQNIKYQGVTESKAELKIRFSDVAERQRALEVLARNYADIDFASSEEGEYFLLRATLNATALKTELDAAMEQNLVVLRNRVNELGVAEPIVQKQGKDRIIVQLPGVQDSAKVTQILGSTATLEYRLVSGTAADWQDAANGGRVPANARLYRERDGNPVLLDRQIIVTGDQIESASAGFDTESGSPAVYVNLDGKGAAKMRKISGANIGKLMAVVFIEQRDGRKVEEVINMATIRDVLSNRFQTTGLDSTEAKDLALLLRAGALRAPMQIMEIRTVGPNLGQDNVDQGFQAAVVGFVLVLIFMVVNYKVFGLFANIALFVNIILTIAVLSLFQATLTVPGIAGIVLSIGMAVDANVLIYERIREELRNGNSIQASIHAGHELAFGTIVDANLTTLIAAIVLFMFGTGPIKGFAVTLSIGILASMFTAVVVSRALVNLSFGGRRLTKLAI